MSIEGPTLVRCPWSGDLREMKRSAVAMRGWAQRACWPLHCSCELYWICVSHLTVTHSETTMMCMHHLVVDNDDVLYGMCILVWLDDDGIDEVVALADEEEEEGSSAWQAHVTLRSWSS